MSLGLTPTLGVLKASLARVQFEEGAVAMEPTLALFHAFFEHFALKT
jgi:hypothetical protein